MKKGYMLFVLLILCVIVGCQGTNQSRIACSKEDCTETEYKDGLCAEHYVEKALTSVPSTLTSTITPEPTATNAPMPTQINTPCPTNTPTPSPSPTNTPTPTPSPSPTNTPTPTPTNTPTPTSSPSPTNTPTPSPRPTNTPTPKPTATPKPSPTNMPKPTATPTPMVFSGQGKKVITNVDIPYNICRITSQHAGERNFIVVLYDNNGDRVEGLVNEIGEYNGMSICTDKLNDGMLDINADGSWNVKIEPIANGGTSNLKGYGNWVSPWFTVNNGANVVTMTNKGESNFIVVVYDETGERVKGLANEIGDYTGEIVFKGEAGKKYCIEVCSSGTWTIDFGVTDIITDQATFNPNNVETQTTIPTPSFSDQKIQENFKILKEYIITNGDAYSDGNRYISYIDAYNGYGVTIDYITAKNIFKFSTMAVNDDLVILLTFEWGETQYEKTVVDAALIYESASYYCVAEAILNGKTYCGEKIGFSITERAYKSSEIEETVLDGWETVFLVGMKNYDKLLSKVNLALCDIGFEEFNR